MTTEQIKAKAEKEFPYRETDKEITMYINQVLGLRQAAYLRCWEENCLPIQKENEKLRNALLELKKMYERSEWIVNIIEVAISEGNGVASEK